MFAMANAQKQPPPDVPKALQPPASEEVILLAHGVGSQIYTCQAGSDGKFAWILKAPEAELMDSEKQTDREPFRRAEMETERRQRSHG